MEPADFEYGRQQYSPQDPSDRLLHTSLIRWARARAGLREDLMRIVVVGAGVIGSIYRGRLAQAGHDVTLLARGGRLSDLQDHGLLLQDAQSGQRTKISVPLLAELSRDDQYDLALVPVRSEQLTGTIPVLLAWAVNQTSFSSVTRPDVRARW